MKNKIILILFAVLFVYFLINTIIYLFQANFIGMIVQFLLAAVCVVVCLVFWKKSKNKDDSSTNVEKKPLTEEERQRIHEEIMSSDYNKNIHKIYSSGAQYILSYSYPDVKVALSDKYDIFDVQVGMYAFLKREPENEHDSKAIAVCVNGNKIGYLPANKLQDMYHDFLIKGGDVTAKIAAIEGNDVYLELSYFQKFDLSMFMKKHQTKKFKLTGSGKEEIQDNIAVLSEGDNVDYSYGDNGKYEAICGDTIGYFPKSAENLLDQNKPAYVYSVDTNDNGKDVVTVVIQCD